MAEISANDRDSPAAGCEILQRQIARAGANVQNWPISFGRYEPCCSPAPPAIDVQTEQMVEQIVARRDIAEHATDARFALVEQCRRHRASKSAQQSQRVCVL